jgi:cobalt-zinc-cadmium efflux system protein
VTADNARRVLLALVLTGGFMLVEVVGGLLTGSLALIADAGHMLTDTAALALAWMAFRVARRPNDGRRTYGYHRFQVLAAFVNGVTLVAVVGWILIEAVRRLFAPVEVIAGPMLAIAVLGLLVNLVALWVLKRGDPGNLNLEGAAVHVLGDLLGSAAAIAAAVVILWTGWMPIDPLLSVLVALLVLRSAWYVVRRSAHILLEGAPDWLDVEALRRDLVAAVPEVDDIHHVHAWMLTDERPLMTLHATVKPDADNHAALLAIQGFLEQRYGVGHATIQIEHEACTEGPPAT